MKFGFTNDEMVTCTVLRDTVVAKQDVKAGATVRVIGNLAKQGLVSSYPYLELVGDGDPQPYADAPMEIILADTSKVHAVDPMVTNRDPEVVSEEEEPAVKPKRKTRAKKAT